MTWTMTRILIASVIFVLCLTACTNFITDRPNSAYYLADNLEVIELVENKLFYYTRLTKKVIVCDKIIDSCQLTSHANIKSIDKDKILVQSYFGVREFNRVDISESSPWDTLVVEVYYIVDTTAIRQRVTLNNKGQISVIRHDESFEGELNEEYKKRCFLEIDLLSTELFKFNEYQIIDHVTNIHIIKKFDGNIILDKKGTEFSAYFQNVKGLLGDPVYLQ